MNIEVREAKEKVLLKFSAVKYHFGYFCYSFAFAL